MKSLRLLKISVHLPIATILNWRKKLAVGLGNPSLRGLELAKNGGRRSDENIAKPLHLQRLPLFTKNARRLNICLI